MNEVDKMVQELRAEFEFSEKDGGNRMVIFGFFSALLLFVFWYLVR
jgi:hypothetical protein